MAALGARHTHISTPEQHFERLFQLYRDRATPPVITPEATPAGGLGTLPAAA